MYFCARVSVSAGSSHKFFLFAPEAANQGMATSGGSTSSWRADTLPLAASHEIAAGSIPNFDSIRRDPGPLKQQVGRFLAARR